MYMYLVTYSDYSKILMDTCSTTVLIQTGQMFCKWTLWSKYTCQKTLVNSTMVTLSGAVQKYKMEINT